MANNIGIERLFEMYAQYRADSAEVLHNYFTTILQIAVRKYPNKNLGNVKANIFFLTSMLQGKPIKKGLTPEDLREISIFVDEVLANCGGIISEQDQESLRDIWIKIKQTEAYRSLAGTEG